MQYHKIENNPTYRLVGGDRIAETATSFYQVLLVRPDHVIVVLTENNKRTLLKKRFNNVIDSSTTDVWSIVDDRPKLVDSPIKAINASGMTKIAHCKQLYQQHILLTKPEIVAIFINVAKCTPQGANTYYLTCVKGIL